MIVVDGRLIDGYMGCVMMDILDACTMDVWNVLLMTRLQKRKSD